MKGLRRKIWAAGFAAAICLLWQAAPVYAAGSVELAADKETAQAGAEVTVKVRTSKPADPTEPPEVSVEYDTTMLLFQSCDTVYGGGGGGLITFSGMEATIRFEAKTAGETEVAASAIIDGDGANKAAASLKIGITGSSKAGASTDAQLKSLSVSPGTLSPAFSPSVTSYALAVPDSVSMVAVSGEPADKDAQIVAAEGFNNLKSGENQAFLTVQAKSGDVMRYEILITRSGSGEEQSVSVPEGNIPLADSSLAVSATFPNEILPAGFVKAEYEYGGQTVESAQFQMGNLVLLYLTDPETGTGDFYIYNAETNSFQDFIQIQGIEGRFIVALTPGEDVKAPEGFTKANIQWNGKTVPGWMLKEAADKGKKDSESQESGEETGAETGEEAGGDQSSALDGFKRLYAGLTKKMAVHAAELEEDNAALTDGEEPSADGSAEAEASSEEASADGAAEDGTEGGEGASPAAAEDGADPSADGAAEGAADVPTDDSGAAPISGEGGTPAEAGSPAPAVSDELSPTDFFLLYAMSSEGREGWYLYDMSEGTYQRYIGAAAAGAGSLIAGMDLKMLLVIILAVACVILLAAVVVLAVKLRGGAYEEPVEEYDTRVNSRAYSRVRGGDEDMEQMRRRVIEKERSAIKRERKALNYLVDRDEEDEEDVEVLTERPARRERTDPALRTGQTRSTRSPREPEQPPRQSRPVKRERPEARERIPDQDRQSMQERPVRRERPSDQNRPVRTDRPERTAGSSAPRRGAQEPPQRRERPRPQNAAGASFRSDASRKPVPRTGARPSRNPELDDEFEFEFLDLND